MSTADVTNDDGHWPHSLADQLAEAVLAAETARVNLEIAVLLVAQLATRLALIRRRTT